MLIFRGPAPSPDKYHQCQEDKWEDHEEADGEGPVLLGHRDISALACEADLGCTFLILCAWKILTLLKFGARFSIAVVVIRAEPSHTVFTLTLLMCGTPHPEALHGVGLDLKCALCLVCACLPQAYVGYAILILSA